MENNKRTKKDAGQEQMHHYFYNVQQELMRQSSSVPGYTVGMMPVPGSSSSSGTSGFVPSTTAPGVPIISHPPAITYRPIRPSDLEVLQEIHEALFPIKYETEFFMNVVHGKGIISWAAVDSNRSDLQCDELIGFVTARVVTATEGEVGYFTQFHLQLSALQFGLLLISFYIAEKGQQQLFLCC
jgi:hypothetical protein